MAGVNDRAVKMLEGAARWIEENAAELVDDLETNHVADDGLSFVIHIAPDRLPTVTANKTYIVLARKK